MFGLIELALASYGAYHMVGWVRTKIKALTDK